MRRVVPELDLFRSVSLPHEHACKLEVMDQILCANPTIVRLVWKDPQGQVKKERLRFGRPGLSSQQVLRSAIIKQMNGFSYEALAFHLADSLTYLRFCGFTHPLDVPRKSALAKNIKRISEATWQKINQVILQYAEAQGLEDGRKVRIDATVTESNIHHPTDSALLFDCVRTLDKSTASTRKALHSLGPMTVGSISVRIIDSRLLLCDHAVGNPEVRSVGLHFAVTHSSGSALALHGIGNNRPHLAITHLAEFVLPHLQA